MLWSRLWYSLDGINSTRGTSFITFGGSLLGCLGFSSVFRSSVSGSLFPIVTLGYLLSPSVARYLTWGGAKDPRVASRYITSSVVAWSGFSLPFLCSWGLFNGRSTMIGIGKGGSMVVYVDLLFSFEGSPSCSFSFGSLLCLTLGDLVSLVGQLAFASLFG